MNKKEIMEEPITIESIKKNSGLNLIKINMMN